MENLHIALLNEREEKRDNRDLSNSSLKTDWEESAELQKGLQSMEDRERVWKRERESKREREMLFNYRKQNRMQISKGIFFKATNKTKTNR